MAVKGLFDMHCHIVPAVDDGAQSVKEAFNMLQMEYEQGVRKIIVTPHFRKAMFETPSEVIKKHFLVLRRLTEKIGPDFKVFLGCEFHANVEMMDYLRSDRVYLMAGSKYVLTEFSASTEERYIKDRLYAMLSNGYKPIIAHIERYNCMRDLDLVESLLNMGACMQINADSVIGKNGHGTKKYCGKLLEEGLVQYIGSDCHGTKHRVTRIGDAYAYVSKKMGQSAADEIFIENPQKILDNAKQCISVAAHR
nr:CpsB/CapC family capsule biosynthesis tyrosine phosphatase [uncultured Blautia sp.]